MAGGFFRRYFQDYTEDRRPGEGGRMHTSRVYRGFLYAPVLTPRQRVLRGILLPLFVLGGGIVFILGAAQRAVCNTLWYTALGTGASLITLLICVIPLFQCVLAPREQTVYQYRAGHRALVLLARIGAGCSALTALFDEYGMSVYVHHTPVPVEYQKIKDYNNLRRSLGRCEDQLTAVGRELFSGMFDRYPNVRLVHSMLGGGFFTFSEMLMPHGPQTPDPSGRFTATPESMRRHLENNLFFEMSHAQPWGRTLLEAAVRIMGADHIVYGSSSPVKAQWQQEGPAFVRALDLTQEEKELLLCGNAKRLYRID